MYNDNNDNNDNEELFSLDYLRDMIPIVPNFSYASCFMDEVGTNSSFVENSDHKIRTIDDIFKNDETRKKDGFPPKAKIKQLGRKMPNGKVKTIIVPYIEEEKFYHDPRGFQPPEGGGSGDGEVGDVIEEKPLDQHQQQGEGDEGDAGDGSGEDHDFIEEAYRVGEVLYDKFKLPNIKDKGKKKAIDEYKYDLTDANLGSGQLLDKKKTVRRILKSNLALGNIEDYTDIDPKKLLVSNQDFWYKILSREKVFESQALVFFMRDYSASMMGDPTEVVRMQHYFLYTALMYNYKKRVETRFIVHDTKAKEVPTFNDYINYNVGGGTSVVSAWKLLNEIVYDEGLEKDYNIFVFYDTDGDDWSSEEGDKETLSEIEKTLQYTSRTGITVISNNEMTSVDKYLNESGFTEKYSDLYRHIKLPRDSSDQQRIIESIKEMIS